MLTKPFDKKLTQLIRDKKIKVRYPKGYQQWKKKFHATLRETRGDVPAALEKIHGKTPKKSEQDT